MSTSLWSVCSVLVVAVLIGCQADHGLVEAPQEGYIDANGHAVGTPYWWRTHPFFEDKKVDEAATLATGDPYLVIMEEEEGETMYARLLKALKGEYSEGEVFHLLLHHRDRVVALEIPGVDMTLLGQEIPPPAPGVTRHDPCECPWEGGECPTGGGGNPPPPPLPDPDPQVNTFMHVFGQHVEEEDLPAPRQVRLYLSTISRNGVVMVFSRLKDVQVEKDAIPVFTQALNQVTFRRVHELKRVFSYGDAHPVFWVSTANHEVANGYRVIWQDASRADIIY